MPNEKKPTMTEQAISLLKNWKMIVTLIAGIGIGLYQLPDAQRGFCGVIGAAYAADNAQIGKKVDRLTEIMLQITQLQAKLLEVALTPDENLDPASRKLAIWILQYQIDSLSKVSTAVAEHADTLPADTAVPALDSLFIGPAAP